MFTFIICSFNTPLNFFDNYHKQKYHLNHTLLHLSIINEYVKIKKIKIHLTKLDHISSEMVLDCIGISLKNRSNKCQYFIHNLKPLLLLNFYKLFLSFVKPLIFSWLTKITVDSHTRRRVRVFSILSRIKFFLKFILKFNIP